MRGRENISICIFHTEFVASGGAEKVVFKELEYFKNKGYVADSFVASVDRKRSFPEIITSYSIHQILPEQMRRFFSNDMMIFWTTVLFLFVIWKFRTYDIFIGENQAATWWAFMAAKFFRKPYFTWQTFPTTITYQRGIDKNVSRVSPPIQMILRVFRGVIVRFDIYVTQKASVAMSCGAYAQGILEKIYKRKVLNCPPGISIGKFNKAMFKQRLKGKVTINKKEIHKPFILITNRHVPEKRLDTAIHVLDRLTKKKLKNLSLVITGAKTMYTASLIKLAKEKKLKDRIIFVGLVDENDLIKLYEQAVLYLYTAPEADYVMGILEAMTYGIPVIAVNKAGPTCIVKDKKTGYLVAFDDHEAFSSRIELLMNDSTLRYNIGKNAFLESKKYTWDTHCQIIEQQIKRFVN